MLLKNLVGAKITKQFVINLFGTDTPSKTQKSDPKTKEEFHQMFFNPSKLVETEHKIKGIAEDIIKKFDSLSKTFIKPDEQFIKELTNHVRDKLSRFLNNQHKEKTTKQQFMREMKKQAMCLEFLMNDLKKQEGKVTYLKEKIKETINSKIAKNKEIECLKVQLKDLKLNKKRHSLKKSMSVNVGNILLMPRRGRKKNFDVVEYANQRGDFGSNIINPMMVADARIKNMEEPILHLAQRIEDMGAQLKTQKTKRNQCKSVIYSSLNFMLQNPYVLNEVGINLQTCVMYKLTLDPGFKSDMIGGEFTSAEKNYIIKSAQLQIKWDQKKQKIQARQKQQRQVQSKTKHSRFPSLGNQMCLMSRKRRKLASSSVAYPSRSSV